MVYYNRKAFSRKKKSKQERKVRSAHSHGILAEPHHATPTNSGERCELKVLHFKNDAHVAGQHDPLAVWKRQKFVVIKNTIQILDPLGVYISIKNDPLSRILVSAKPVDDFSQNAAQPSKVSGGTLMYSNLE